MATQQNPVIASINQAIADAKRDTINEINDHMTKLLVENNAEIKLLATQLADIRKALESTPKSKKIASAPADGTAPADPAAAAPAAKPKGGKKPNHASWFKTTYETDVTFRARIDAIPEIALTIAALQAELKNKKTDKSRANTCANAIIVNHGPLVQAEYEAQSVTLLIPAASPK